jgi:hypothetical protein
MKRKRAVLDELLVLDSLTAPGLPQSKFRGIFAKCGCGWITTRRAFGNHECVKERTHSVIDLTSDSDDHDDSINEDDLIDLTTDDDDLE